MIDVFQIEGAAILSHTQYCYTCYQRALSRNDTSSYVYLLAILCKEGSDDYVVLRSNHEIQTSLRPSGPYVVPFTLSQSTVLAALLFWKVGHRAHDRALLYL